MRPVRNQSALIVPVPEAEPVIGEFRSRHDPSASAGVPAHITINYPFLPNAADEPGATGRLAHRFADLRSFRYSLARIEQFSGILYLAPSPGDRFSELIEGVAELFPQYPPYGGSIDIVIPHLTVAVCDDVKNLEAVREDLVAACQGKLPIVAHACEVWLMENRCGLWTKRVSFALLSEQ